MKYMLAIVLAVGCGDNVEAPGDAPVVPDMKPDAPSCPAGIVTWRDVLAYWDELRCAAMERCFPIEFATWYVDIEGCKEAFGAWHCMGGDPSKPSWCDSLYPVSRCGNLDQCREFSETFTCSWDVIIPKSCEIALD